MPEAAGQLGTLSRTAQNYLKFDYKQAGRYGLRGGQLGDQVPQAVVLRRYPVRGNLAGGDLEILVQGAPASEGTILCYQLPQLHQSEVFE